MKFELYVGGALVGVVGNVDPGNMVNLAFRLLPEGGPAEESLPARAAREAGAVGVPLDGPCHCLSGKLFMDCHGAPDYVSPPHEEPSGLAIGGRVAGGDDGPGVIRERVEELLGSRRTPANVKREPLGKLRARPTQTPKPPVKARKRSS